MGVNVSKRKGQRAYDASARRTRAHAKLEATLDYAHRLFLEHGYAATTVKAIAEAAGVSPATIYKTYGGKAALVRSLCQRALAGEGPLPAEVRSNALRSGEDPAGVIEGWAALLTEVSPRLSPLLLLLRAASEVDREADALFAELDAQRLDRMADNARHLAAGGHLRAEVSVDRARDILWFITSPEFYELLVIRRGWSPEDLRRMAADTMTAALL